jgi:hypothetical protein
VDFLNALCELKKTGLQALPAIEIAIKLLDEHGQHELSGLLCFYTGLSILEATGAPRQAMGYIDCAFRSYKVAGSKGLCQHLVTLFPDLHRCITPAPSVLAQIILDDGRSTSTSQLETSSMASSRPSDAVPLLRENLDALT